MDIFERDVLSGNFNLGNTGQIGVAEAVFNRELNPGWGVFQAGIGVQAFQKEGWDEHWKPPLAIIISTLRRIRLN